MSTFKRDATSFAKEANWLSQNEREMIMRDKYATISLKTISV